MGFPHGKPSPRSWPNTDIDISFLGYALLSLWVSTWEGAGWVYPGQWHIGEALLSLGISDPNMHASAFISEVSGGSPSPQRALQLLNKHEEELFLS